MKNKKNTLRSELKKFRNEEKITHKKELNKIVDETLHNQLLNNLNYKFNKKLQWKHYFLVIFFSAIITAISFLIGIFIIKDIKKVNWVIFAFFWIVVSIWFICGWYKNKLAASYYNDARRRYQLTYTEQEANIIRFRKLLLLISLLQLIAWLVTFFTL